MKALLAGLLITVSVAGIAQAKPASNGEIGYPNGSIGYDALVLGDNEKAIAQILADSRVSRQDPARLINLGQAYARTGRVFEALAMFNAARDAHEPVDLILADGRVMSSDDAAGKALASLQARLASR